MAGEDRITIECPLCPLKHEYPLVVKRSLSIGLAGPGTAQTRRRSFVRLFSCPTTSGQFQATLTLSETALDRIKDVSVGEPAHG